LFNFRFTYSYGFSVSPRFEWLLVSTFNHLRKYTLENKLVLRKTDVCGECSVIEKSLIIKVSFFIESEEIIGHFGPNNDENGDQKQPK
jgi:hypothetical protein